MLGGLPSWQRSASSGGALMKGGGSLLAFDPPSDRGDATEGVAPTRRAFGSFVRGAKWGIGSKASR